MVVESITIFEESERQLHINRIYDHQIAHGIRRPFSERKEIGDRKIRAKSNIPPGLPNFIPTQVFAHGHDDPYAVFREALQEFIDTVDPAEWAEKSLEGIVEAGMRYGFHIRDAITSKLIPIIQKAVVKPA